MLGERALPIEDYEGCGACPAHAAEVLVKLLPGRRQSWVYAPAEVGYVSPDFDRWGRGDGTAFAGPDAVFDALARA